MKIHHLFPLAVCLVAAYAYDFEIFRQEIDPKCLNRLWQSYDKFEPLALTMESFISMVEKVEAKHTDWDLYDVTRVLLQRFAFEGIVFQERANKRTATQQTEYISRWIIIRELLGEGREGPKFDENDLDDIEKCTMFLMMGHLVNTTMRQGDEEDDRFDAPHEAQPMPPSGMLKSQSDPRSKRAKNPREQGVVTVRGDSREAVSVSKVLNAILASRNRNDYNIYELYGSTVQSIKDFPRDKTIKPLLGVTLGDVLSYAAIHKKEGTSGRRFFGAGGNWNGTICPTEYRLQDRTKGVTNALLRGAVDGLAIGITLQRQSSIERDNRLSRLLRMYYSYTGLPDTSSSNVGRSYCRRAQISDVGTNEIQTSAIAFYFVHYAKELAQLGADVDNVIGEAIGNMNSALNELDGELSQNNGACKQRSPPTPTADDPICETPSNVFVVLDTSEIRTDGFSEQEEIIGHLASKLDIGVGASSMSVFYDTRGGENNGLKAVYFNATNPACATCATSRIERRDVSGFEGETALLDALNKTLQHFEQRIEREPGVPNKVAVVFRYTDIRDTDKNRLTATVNMLRDGHRDTRVLIVGKNMDALRPLTPDPNDVLTPQGAQEQANIIAQKICKVPATLQFHRCSDHSKQNRQEDQNVYDGYVTPNHVQYWAFYPEYFLKSYNIQIKITATNGDIRVCEERGVSTPGFREKTFLKDKCRDTTAGAKELVFHFKNPCHKYHVHNCSPINFAIIGLPTTTQATVNCPANDNKCRRLDQVNFKVAHDGIFCSGCEFLKASPVVLLFVSIAYFFNKSS